MRLKIFTFKITSISPMGHWINRMPSLHNPHVCVVTARYMVDLAKVYQPHERKMLCRMACDLDSTSKSRMACLYVQGRGSLFKDSHYCDAIMGTVASQVTSLTIVYTTVYSDADQSKHQSSASLAFLWGIHRGPVNSPHKVPVTRKMFPFDDVIMGGISCDVEKTCLLKFGRKV